MATLLGTSDTDVLFGNGLLSPLEDGVGKSGFGVYAGGGSDGMEVSLGGGSVLEDLESEVPP